MWTEEKKKNFHAYLGLIKKKKKSLKHHYKTRRDPNSSPWPKWIKMNQILRGRGRWVLNIGR